MAGGKQPRQTDAGNKYDRLFRAADGTYEFYDPKVHGVWEIAQDASGTRSVRQVTDISPSGRAEDSIDRPEAPSRDSPSNGAGRFALEAHLRDYLAQNLEAIPDLPSRLSLFVDDSGVPGVEYRTDVGIVDILARGNEGAFYVLELKLGRGPDATLGQTQRYMGWVKQRLAGNHAVYGVIITAETSDKLRYAASVATGIFLMEYDLKVALRISKPVGT